MMVSSPTDDGSPPTPSDEEMRKLLKPNPTNDQVLAALSQTHPNKKLIVKKELESYDDKNFLVVDVNDGTQYLAKVHNGVESQDYLKRRSTSTSVIDLQNFIFQHLASHNVTTSCPIPSSTSTNEEVVSVHDLPVASSAHSPAKLVLRLLTWVPGVPMCSVPSKSLSPESLADAGVFLGKVRLALDDLSTSNANAVEASKRYHVWDQRNLLDLATFTDYIADDGRRALVTSVLDAFRETFGEDRKKVDLNMGILQGDFNDANIIMNDGNVSGVIDFGDSTYSWRVLDITVAMAYAMLTPLGKSGRSLSAASSMLRGFNSIYPLTDVERKHLRLLIASRLACSVTLGAYSSKQDPDNEYLLLHAQPAWDALGLIWGQGKSGVLAESIDNLFAVACSANSASSDGNIDCLEISIPDPIVPDVLRPVRSAWDDAHSKPSTAKKQKVEGGVRHVPAITFVTGNRKKLEEVKRILSTENGPILNVPFELTNHKLDLPELQGDTLHIAKEKCALAAQKLGSAVITEDTSLCYNALKGLPGPYVKWFLDSTGLQGLNDMLAFTSDKSAYAQTVVAFCPGPGKDVVTFEGRTQGKIVPARGQGFGWDPVFCPDESSEGLTYAEMSPASKDAISHRSRSFLQLRDYFQRDEDSIKGAILK